MPYREDQAKTKQCRIVPPVITPIPQAPLLAVNGPNPQVRLNVTWHMCEGSNCMHWRELGQHFGECGLTAFVPPPHTSRAGEPAKLLKGST